MKLYLTQVKLTTIHPFTVDTGLAKKPRSRLQIINMLEKLYHTYKKPQFQNFHDYNFEYHPGSKVSHHFPLLPLKRRLRKWSRPPEGTMSKKSKAGLSLIKVLYLGNLQQVCPPHHNDFTILLERCKKTQKKLTNVSLYVCMSAENSKMLVFVCFFMFFFPIVAWEKKHKMLVFMEYVCM